MPKRGQKISVDELNALAALANQKLLPLVQARIGGAWPTNLSIYPPIDYCADLHGDTPLNPVPAYGFLDGTVGTNLVPSGAVYDGSGNYALTIVPQSFYRWQAGVNDSGFTFYSATDSLSSGDLRRYDFMASANGVSVVLQGTPGAAVTAKFRQNNNNWIHELNRIRFHLYVCLYGPTWGSWELPVSDAAKLLVSGPWVIGVNDPATYRQVDVDNNAAWTAGYPTNWNDVLRLTPQGTGSRTRAIAPGFSGYTGAPLVNGVQPLGDYDGTKYYPIIIPYGAVAFISQKKAVTIDGFCGENLSQDFSFTTTRNSFWDYTSHLAINVSGGGGQFQATVSFNITLSGSYANAHAEHTPATPPDPSALGVTSSLGAVTVGVPVYTHTFDGPSAGYYGGTLQVVYPVTIVIDQAISGLNNLGVTYSNPSAWWPDLTADPSGIAVWGVFVASGTTVYNGPVYGNQWATIDGANWGGAYVTYLGNPNPSGGVAHFQAITFKYGTGAVAAAPHINALCHSGAAYRVDFPSAVTPPTLTISDGFTGFTPAPYLKLSDPAARGVWVANTLPLAAMNTFLDTQIPPYVTDWDGGDPELMSMNLSPGWFNQFPITTVGQRPATPYTGSARQATLVETGPYLVTAGGYVLDETSLFGPEYRGIRQSCQAQPSRWPVRRSTEDLQFSSNYYVDGSWANWTVQVGAPLDASFREWTYQYRPQLNGGASLAFYLVKRGTAGKRWKGSTGQLSFGDPLAVPPLLLLTASDSPVYPTAYYVPGVYGSVPGDLQSATGVLQVPAAYLQTLRGTGKVVYLTVSYPGSSSPEDWDLVMDNVYQGNNALVSVEPGGVVFGVPAGVRFSWPGSLAYAFTNRSFPDSASATSAPTPRSGFCLYTVCARRLPQDNGSGVRVRPASGAAVVVTLGQNKLLATSSVTFIPFFHPDGVTPFTITIPAGAASSGYVEVFWPVLDVSGLVYQASEAVDIEALANFQPKIDNRSPFGLAFENTYGGEAFFVNYTEGGGLTTTLNTLDPGFVTSKIQYPLTPEIVTDLAAALRQL